MRHDAERLYVPLALRQATIGPANRSSCRKGETCFSLIHALGARPADRGSGRQPAGCGVVAFPVRTTSAAVKIVPVAGDVVAYPLDKTADAID